MHENRRQILEMLAEGKITSEQAERLLAALDAGSNDNASQFPSVPSNGNGSKNGTPRVKPKYLRVLVLADEGGKNAATVNVRVPMQLLRAGVRLASLIPAQAHEHLDETLSQHGIPLTLSQIKPENLEELIDHLDDLTVDVDAKEGNAKVRVFCE